MATVIVGPGSDDPGYLQEQIDDLSSDVSVLEARSYAEMTVVSVPSALVQITHGLAFEPASVLCIETSGDIAEPAAIHYPLPGVVEVVFGTPFTGQIRLS